VAEAQCTCSTREDGLIVIQTPSYSTSNVELSHAKSPDSVADAQNTCSTGEHEFIVGQTPSYWPSNVPLSHAKRPGIVWSRANARVVQVRKG